MSAPAAATEQAGPRGSLFHGFARVWTPVAFARELRASRPLALTVMGTKVALFRDGGGRAVALLDRCPHRGVALSLGSVSAGCITCPFHGWRLDATGQVTHVPWNPDARLDLLRGWPLPARELGGLVWIYTALGEAPHEPTVHADFLDASLRVAGEAVVWRAHWTRAMENMLDWPHLPFVHRRTIGRALATRAERRLDIAWEEHPWGARTRIAIDGADEPGELDFRWPNQMNLFVRIPRRRLVLAVACVPIDERHTRMMLVSARSFLRARAFDFVFNRMNRRIAAEDRAIVESSEPVEIPAPALERSVRTDAPTLHFRKRFLAELATSAAPLDG